MITICPNCGAPLASDPEEVGLSASQEMGGITTFAELSAILEEVGCDAIPVRFHNLTLDDLDRWMRR